MKVNGTTLKVTKKHIRDGIPGDPCNCAIALALKEHFDTESVHVNTDGVSFETSIPVVDDEVCDVKVGCYFGKKGVEFIKKFDRILDHEDDRDARKYRKRLKPVTLKIQDVSVCYE